jgi:hypothetical protein
MVAFEGFPCYWFEPVGDAPARGWLRADVSIECTTEEHASLTTVAWTAVVIYPVGLFFGCLVMLWKASTAIVSDKPTPFSRSISFLYREYKVKTYWWELMEILRKFLLIGLLVTIEPGSVIQIVMGTVVCATYLVCTAASHELRRVARLLRVPRVSSLHVRASGRWCNCRPSHTPNLSSIVKGLAPPDCRTPPTDLRSCVAPSTPSAPAATTLRRARASACSCFSSVASSTSTTRSRPLMT